MATALLRLTENANGNADRASAALSWQMPIQTKFDQAEETFQNALLILRRSVGKYHPISLGVVMMKWS